MFAGFALWSFASLVCSGIILYRFVFISDIMETNLENARQRIQDGGFYAVTWRHKNEIKRLLSYLLEQAAFHLIKAEFF